MAITKGRETQYLGNHSCISHLIRFVRFSRLPAQLIRAFSSLASRIGTGAELASCHFVFVCMDISARQPPSCPSLQKATLSLPASCMSGQGIHPPSRVLMYTNRPANKPENVDGWRGRVAVGLAQGAEEPGTRARSPRCCVHLRSTTMSMLRSQPPRTKGNKKGHQVWTVKRGVPRGRALPE